MCKDAGCRWDGECWKHYVPKYAGTPEDSAAAVANKLLSMGYVVRVPDAEIRRKAAAADFVEEATRTISLCMSGEWEGWLSIRWRGRDNNLYRAAREIKGSRYSGEQRGVMVKPQYGDLIEDFADLFGFVLSPGAEAAIAEWRESLTPTGIKKKQKEKAESAKDKLAQKLESQGVISDLIDDEN